MTTSKILITCNFHLSSDRSNNTNFTNAQYTFRAYHIQYAKIQFIYMHIAQVHTTTNCAN